MTENTFSNNLKNENSSFLKMYQNDAIQWWPFGPDPFQLALDQNKPTFLFIGHSSCYLTDLMHNESFLDRDIANYLNENFVCVLVDREEFPDIDHYYQMASLLYSKTTGWPLSAFLLPDMTPYFVGNYFSSISSKENTSFMDLIRELNRAYKEEQEQIKKNAQEAREKILEGPVPGDRVEFEGHFPHPMSIMNAIKQFQDDENGGHGEAPKFPNFSFYEWALEQMLEGIIEKEAGEHIIKTLERMLMGGIHDHARGGFHRCSTDNNWLVPSFEKLLYDQAGLIKILAKLGFFLPTPLVFDCLTNTIDFLEREVLGNEHYFFSGQSADSENVDGLYYTFTKEEFIEALESFEAGDQDKILKKNLDQILDWFNITGEGNFHHRLNILSLNHRHKERLFGKENWPVIRKAREAILKARQNRVPPPHRPQGSCQLEFHADLFPD